MTPAVLDQVERALEAETKHHSGFSRGSMSVDFDGNTSSEYEHFPCRCALCEALSALRAARKDG